MAGAAGAVGRVRLMDDTGDPRGRRLMAGGS